MVHTHTVRKILKQGKRGENDREINIFLLKFSIHFIILYKHQELWYILNYNYCIYAEYPYITYGGKIKYSSKVSHHMMINPPYTHTHTYTQKWLHTQDFNSILNIIDL